MEAKRTDRYTEEELEDEELEEEQEENKKNKRQKAKTKKKTSKKTKKSKPKKKVVNKNKEKKSSGLFTFFLIVVILVLIAVVAYLLYVSYYEEDNTNDSNNNQTETTNEMCEAKATKYNISSGLNKCSDSAEFNLTITGTDLSFDITRNSNDSYTINTVYYDKNPISTSLSGLTVNNEWDLKTDGEANYLLVGTGDSTVFTVINSNGSIYNGTENTVYELGSDVTYTRYTILGLEEVNTCDYYKENNQLDAELWTEGALTYENGQINENDDKTIIAEDVCK